MEAKRNETLAENYDFLLLDRLQKIRSINELYDLENNAYIAYSGGKDSTVLSRLIDEALPGNHIPRVFINTGIEYKKVVAFVERERERDGRITMVAPTRNIKQTLEEYGYPFKSKEHSQRIHEFKAGNQGHALRQYFRELPTKRRQCPLSLMYQTGPEFTLNVSDRCCDKLKKEPMHRYEKTGGRTIAITGMLREEGGMRNRINCIVTDSKTGGIKRFHPMAVVTKEFEDWYIKTRNIELCELYYAPYSFQRTGCKGCPFSLDLQNQLTIMQIYMPEERKQCELIWKPVYDEYRRIGYRLQPDAVQSLFENDYK